MARLRNSTLGIILWSLFKGVPVVEAYLYVDVLCSARITSVLVFEVADGVAVDVYVVELDDCLLILLGGARFLLCEAGGEDLLEGYLALSSWRKAFWISMKFSLIRCSQLSLVCRPLFALSICLDYFVR